MSNEPIPITTIEDYEVYLPDLVNYANTILTFIQSPDPEYPKDDLISQIVNIREQYNRGNKIIGALDKLKAHKYEVLIENHKKLGPVFDKLKQYSSEDTPKDVRLVQNSPAKQFTHIEEIRKMNLSLNDLILRSIEVIQPNGVLKSKLEDFQKGMKQPPTNADSYNSKMTQFIKQFYSLFMGNNLRLLDEELTYICECPQLLISRANNDDIRNDVLVIIRASVDFVYEGKDNDKFGISPAQLSSRIIKQYWNSRKFLEDQAIEQIPPFEKHLREGISSINTNNLEILFKDNYKAIASSKKNGDAFGIVLSLLNECENLTEQYFIKGYEQYPIKKQKENSTEIKTEEAIKTTTFLDSYSLPYLAEPFAYKILEHFGIGPFSHFIINPFISRGFYIATEGLSKDNNSFIMFSNLKKYNSIFEQSKDKQNLYQKITKVDIIIRIMLLSDMNDDNIGFVKKWMSGNK
ncbi:hypothetical protein TVAG_152460 [Trichomonas vaginalis G3]|uniref:Uncharacterized protein n=1 Tax=Trichomonas vaginalis (strain ATCC PRA-98 / G3) TaxID=412133 RepID=A2FPJ4_TRIV3|nr:protein CBG06246 family [Trichomonas vaginalis G3]EAX93158.1 hypothetical protein TVAG_152460 [Trichomonas vaginalis G3]KAI5509867.1 protein CBG06246 family [Trichomonas vaginalis G3]|eukprot:XP_001306088.1 hypothetical protein [Trichomonas vaginalis G3]